MNTRSVKFDHVSCLYDLSLLSSNIN
jgi:hypothetical protein